MAILLTKLDNTQRQRAAIETEAGRTFEVRFVVTYVNSAGQRALAHAQQGRCTYATPEEALAWIVAAKANNNPAALAPVFGDVELLQVRAAAVYPNHHDPLSAYFDSDADNPDLFVAGVAFETWAGFNDSEKHGCSLGLFPAPKMALADHKLQGIVLRERTVKLSLALMELAAHRSQGGDGVSLAALGKVQRKRSTARAR